MNLGTDILAKIMDEAKSMTVKEYEELFEDSQQLEEIDIVNIEIHSPGKYSACYIADYKFCFRIKEKRE